MTIFHEICLAIILGSLGITANVGILIFSRILGTGPKPKKLSFGGYSTDETNSEQRSTRMNSYAQRLSETRLLKRASVLGPNAAPSLLRLSSMLSINRLDTAETAPIKDRFQHNSKISLQLKGRRHLIYLKGLLILSSSNLLTGCLLLINSFIVYWHQANEEISQTNNYTVNTYIYSISMSSCFDLLQALEICAILWIAVNRAYAIHSTSRHSNRKTSETVTRYIQGNAVHESRIRVRHGGCCLSRSKEYRPSSVRASLEYSAIPTERVFLLRLQKYSRYLVCLLPLFVISIAVVRSTVMWVKNSPAGEGNFQLITNSIYYTTAMHVGVLIGICLMPISFLLTTNCMIYRKVRRNYLL